MSELFTMILCSLNFAFSKCMKPKLERILLVPSVLGRLSSVFGGLQNPVLLALSTKNNRFRTPSKPSAS